MTHLLALATTRLWSGGFWLAAALLLALAASVVLARKGKSAVPPLTLAALAGLLVLVAAVALYIEGETDGGNLLLFTGLALAALTIPVLMVTQKPWLLAPQFALLGIGALWLPDGSNNDWTTWALSGVGVLLAGQLFLLFLTGAWWAPLAYALAGGGLLIIGGRLSKPLGTGLAQAAGLIDPERVALSEPWWLLLLLLIPWLVWTSYRSLAGLGHVRAAVAIGLRAALVLLLTLALANLQLRRVDETVTVFFLLDCSESVPLEERNAVLLAIKKAVAERPPERLRDQIGLIPFGAEAMVYLPAARAYSLPATEQQLADLPVNGKRTNLSAALKLALASFPGGTAKRVVVLSDGNENLGRAEEQALIYKNNRVQIDVVPMALGERNPNEVLIERIDPSSEAEEGLKRSLYVTLRSLLPDDKVVVGNLQVYRTSLEKVRDRDTGEEDYQFSKVELTDPRTNEKWRTIRLKPGVNVEKYDRVIDPEKSSTFEAVFTPIRVETEAGVKVADGLPGDRKENNRASTSVVGRGKSRVLLIENGMKDEKSGLYKPGEHQVLVASLRKANAKREVVVKTADKLPQDPAELLDLLSNFDCVILANVPVEKINEAQQKVLRDNTHDQGCGMVVIGGRYGYGAGGWSKSKLEEAWPVQCELKSLKVEGKGGLVLVMHASEIAEGNMWQKKIARLAVEKLSAVDMVGMVYYDMPAGPKWHIKFQQVGPNRGRLLNLVDSMNPGDMPDAEPHLRMAYDELTDKKHGLGTKHIIFISDGDHWQPPVQLLAKIKAAKITCTTVCITSHGQNEYKKMAEVAKLTGGTSYPKQNPDGSFTPLNPKELPAIYIKEVRRVSQSFIHDKPFTPYVTDGGQKTDPTKNLPAKLPVLGGFVRTSKRDSPGVQETIKTPKLGELQFPILAQWQYGAGTVLAFTSNAQTVVEGPEAWDKEWAKGGMYESFWVEAVKYASRRDDQEDGPKDKKKDNLRAKVETRDNRTFVVIEARGANKEPLFDLKVTARVTAARQKEGQNRELEFRQRKPGEYEAELRAEDDGAYFLNVRAKRRGGKADLSLRTVVTVPYSPEFSELRANPELLELLRRITDGTTGLDETFRPAPMGSLSLQSIWYWLLVLTGVGLVLDVAVRRIALEPAKWSAALRAYWDRLAGRPVVAAAVAAPAERLQTRPTVAGAERRFEAAADVPMMDVPSATGETPQRPTAPRPGARAPGVTPEAPQEAGDAMSRLMRAKKRAHKDRDKDKQD